METVSYRDGKMGRGGRRKLFMIEVIIYLVVAAIASYIFQLVAGLTAGAPMLIWGFITQKSTEDIFEKNPRLFLSIGVLNHATIGVLYALLIYLFSAYFVYGVGGSFWLYFVLSILWSLSTLGGISEFMAFIFLVACTGGVLLLWFFNIYLLVLLWIILLAIFIPMYLKMAKPDPIEEDEEMDI